MALDAGTIMATLALTTNPFKASMDSARRDLQTFANSSNDTNKRMSALSSAMTSVGSTLSSKVSLPIIGVGAAALKMSGDFDSQMSRVQSTADASGAQMAILKKQAIDLGASTSFSAGEAAEGMENLASAGFTVNEITKAMPGMMDLAAASGESLASSSDIAATTLRGFGLAASDAGHVADVLAKSANATNASVASTGEAMKYVAPVAHTMGQSMEEVTAAIGEMANQGIQGSQAGTTLRSAMVSLASPTKQASALMKEIGFNAFDANGKMLPLNQVIGRLQDSTKNMTQQQKANTLATIFGTDALSGMQVLLNEGQGNLQKLTKSLKDSDGAAQKAAKTNQDNLKGSLDGLKGSLESAAIAVGEILTPAIRGLADHLGWLVAAFNKTSPATKVMIVSVLGIVAAVGPALLIFAKLIQSAREVKMALDFVKEGKLLISTVHGIGNAFHFMATGANPVILILTAIALGALLIYKNWDTIGPYFRKVWTIVTAAFTAAKNTIVSVWSSITGFFSSIWNGITSGVSAALSGIQAGWAALVSGIQTVFSAIGGFFVSIWNGIIAGIQSFITTVQGLWAGITNILMLPFAFLQAGVQAIFSGVIAVIKTVFIGPILLIVGLIQSIFTGNWNYLSTYATAIWTTLTTGVLNIITGFRDIFIGIWLGIRDTFLAVWNAVALFVIAIWTNIRDGVISIVTGIVIGVQTIWNGLIAFFVSLPGTMYNIAVTIFNFFSIGVTTVITATVNSARAIFNGLVSFFANLPGTMLSIATNIFNFFKNGVINVITNTVAGAKQIFSNLISWFSGLPKSFLSIGKDLMQGLWDGLKAVGSKVVNYAKQLADDLLTGMKHVFGIASPSKETYAMGGYLIQGLGNAIIAGATSIRKVMAKVFGGAVNFAKGIFSNMEIGAWITAALAQTGTSMAWMPAIQQLIKKESGGNPLAVNSTGVGGQHATGLMQMLPSTFKAYAARGHGNITNPIDNLMSSINYIKARYGSPYNIPNLFGGNYVGYANGVKSAMSGMHAVAEKGLEIVGGKALKLFQGGETVLNNKDSLNLLSTIANLQNVMQNAKGLDVATQTQMASTNNAAMPVNINLNGNYAFTNKEAIDYLSTRISRTIAGRTKGRV